MCFPRRSLTVSCNHNIVPSECIGDHRFVLTIKDLGVQGLWSKHAIKAVYLFATLVGKCSVIIRLPVDLFEILNI